MTGKGPCEPGLNARVIDDGVPYCPSVCAAQAGYRSRVRAGQAFGILCVLLSGAALLFAAVYRSETLLPGGGGGDAAFARRLPARGAGCGLAAVLCAWVALGVVLGDCPCAEPVVERFFEHTPAH